MRPLVEATVGDGTGTVRATFFNQPWLVERYPVGTRLMLHGKADGGGRFSVQGHAPTEEMPVAADSAPDGPGAVAHAVAHYPATDGLSSTQILALVGEHAVNFDDVLEPLPAALRRARAPARPPRRPARGALSAGRRGSGAGAPPARVRGAAVRAVGAAAAPPQPPGGRGGAGSWQDRGS